jgi:hypothetical protein
VPKNGQSLIHATHNDPDLKRGRRGFSSLTVIPFRAFKNIPLKFFKKVHHEYIFKKHRKLDCFFIITHTNYWGLIKLNLTSKFFGNILYLWYLYLRKNLVVYSYILWLLYNKYYSVVSSYIMIGLPTTKLYEYLYNL